MSEDRRTNLEKLDDAGLVTDLVFEKYGATLDALPPELVDEMIRAFNSEQPWREPETAADPHTEV